MVYHPNEFDTAVTLGQNEPLYCNVPDSLSESLARARLQLHKVVVYIGFKFNTYASRFTVYIILLEDITIVLKPLLGL